MIILLLHPTFHISIKIKKHPQKNLDRDGQSRKNT